MIITPIIPFSNDDRGFVAEYTGICVATRLVVFSKAGAIRGRHYHKGISATKNPEILLLLSGTCVCHWRTVGEPELHTREVTAPAKLEIPVFTWHELIAITDCTLMEFNSLEEQITDTFYDG